MMPGGKLLKWWRLIKSYLTNSSAVVIQLPYVLEYLEVRNIILYMADNKHCGKNFVPIMTNRGNKDHYLKLMVYASSKDTLKVDEQELGKLIIINCLFMAGRNLPR